MKACGLNFADIYTRQGLVRNEPGPPFIMGLECSGLVVSVGSKVENLKVSAVVKWLSFFHSLYSWY